MKIILPWPDSRLMPNAKRRSHWRAYQPVAKREREVAHYLAKASHGFQEARTALSGGEGHIVLQIRFYPPDKRHRDDDGMIGAFKHARDGVADALEVDDRRFRPHYFFEDSEKPGRVEIVFPNLADGFTKPADSAKESGPERCANTQPALTSDTYEGGACGS